jgi:hypothetical protein
MKKYNSILFLFVILFSTSLCSSSKELSDKSIDSMDKDVTYVKIFPGQQDGIVRIKLEFSLFSDNDGVVIDSVYFRNEYSTVDLKHFNNYIMYNAIFRGKSHSELPNKLKNIQSNEAYVFYRIDKRNFFYKLENIIEKESIYLP